MYILIIYRDYIYCKIVCNCFWQQDEMINIYLQELPSEYIAILMSWIKYL